MSTSVATDRTHDNRTATERWVLLACVLASGMAFIDATALNVALPAIQTQFDTTGTHLLWIINAYALMVAALLLPGGALGDRHGHRRLLMIGVILFAIASLACGLASSVNALIAARMLQGLGAAIMLPGSLSLIATTFDVSHRGRAIGTWSALCVVMTALGPLLGGLLAQAGLWRGVFLINPPLAALCLAILRIKAPVDRGCDSSGPLDVAGGLLSVAGIATLSFGLIESTNRAWNDPLVVSALATSMLCLVLFLLVERRAAHPLLPLSLGSNRMLVAAGVMTLCFYSGIFGMMFLLSLNLMQIQQYRPVQAGLALAPLMLLVLMISPVAGLLADRVGLRHPIVVGGGLGCVGFLLLAVPAVTTGPQEYWTSYFPALSVLGVSLGLCAAPLSTAVLNAAGQQHLGTAAGINATLSRLSSVLGIAILGPLALQTFQSALLSHAVELQLTSRQVSVLRTESAKLAETRPPSDLPGETARELTQSIRQSFVRAFRVVAITCAVAVGLGTLSVSLLFPRERVA